MPSNAKKSRKREVTKEATQNQTLSDAGSFVYVGKHFAFSVLISGLAALYYWYSHLSPASGSPLGSGVNGDTYYVVDIEGKGKGAVATRDIKRGDLILRERPLFVVPHSVHSSAAALVYGELQNLSLQERQLFLNLSYVNFPIHLDKMEHPEEVALAIFQTNAVSAGGNVGIFPRLARINHGCSSAFNAVYHWREHERHIMVHALKDIPKGKELLTAYVDTKRPRDERRTYLRQQYGFHCKCDVCSLPDELSKASDARLSEISRLYREFATWGSQEIEGPQAIDYIRKIWKLEDKEGYWSERGQLSADAAWIAASHSDLSAVKEWARLAAKWFSYEIGADSRQSREMERIVDQPESHSAWGKRPSLIVGGPE